MTETSRINPPTLDTLESRMFPMLTPEQISRIGTHGRVRCVQSGEVLVEAGDQNTRLFVVISGHVEIVRVSDGAEALVRVLRPGQFSGEANLLSGRRGFVRIRAGAPGELIEVDREHFLALVQTDGALGEILMRAFILRRVELIARGMGDAVLMGSNHSAGTLRVKDGRGRRGDRGRVRPSGAAGIIGGRS